MLMSLRTAIPLLLVLFAVGTTLYSLHFDSSRALNRVERNGQADLTRLMTREQESLEYLLRAGDLQRLKEAVAALGVESDVSMAMVIDDHEHVIAAMRRDDIGRALAEVIKTTPGPQWSRYFPAMKRARAIQAGTVALADDRSAVFGVYPLVLGSRGAALRPDRIALLLVQEDLKPQKAHALFAVRQQAISFSLFVAGLAALLWVLAYFVVTRRLQRLVFTIRRIGTGDLTARSGLAGQDELGTLGAAVDQMAHQISETGQLLRDSEQRFRATFEQAAVGISHISLDGRWLRVNQRLCDIVGYTREELLAFCIQDITHRDDLPADREHLRHLHEGRVPNYSLEKRYIRKDGTPVWVEVTVAPVRGRDRSPAYFVSVAQDISQRRAAQQALAEERERALVTLHSIGDAVVTTDSTGRIDYLNPVAEGLTGWSVTEARGRPLQEVFNIFNELTMEPMTNPVEKCLRDGRVVGLANHTMLVSRDGSAHAIEDSAAPIRDHRQRIIGVVLVFHDVSKARQMATELSWQATHDRLTGLVNRYDFERRLQGAIDSARDGEHSHALLYLDLDQFKVVNDTCGHAAGDKLLKQLAGVLHEQVRESDTLARLGGDEFGVLLEQCPLDRAVEIAAKLRSSVREYRFLWHDKAFEVGVSIGLVVLDSHSEDLGGVLSAADMACYTAKDLGRNRLHVYQADDVDLQQRRGEMHTVTRITGALKENRFRLYQQPMVSVADPNDDRNRHHEILLRMIDDDGRLIPPGGFIPAAERYGLMPAIDRWVIAHFFEHQSERLQALAGACGRQGTCDCSYSINLSGASIGDDNLLDYITELRQRYGVPSEVLCFEITETAAIANLAKASQFIRALKAQGFRFALDDFGSGVSSFNYLKNLPVDYLKIDGGFVKDMLDDPIDREMVKAINQIGHIMGIKTTAEFVESDAILQALREIGVDYAQGYGIQRPQPL